MVEGKEEVVGAGLTDGVLRGGTGVPSSPESDLSCLPIVPPVEPACANDALDVAVTASTVRTAMPNGAIAFLI
jgi:hypothetical protein